MGDDITIERSNVKALQKKAKPSVPEQGKKQKRRKRFGHSILHRCPGHLYAQLHSKFSENHFHVVDNMYRASQYDHKSNSYNKKKLSQRLAQIRGRYKSTTRYLFCFFASLPQ